MCFKDKILVLNINLTLVGYISLHLIVNDIE
jgi:hypothetical protein